MFVWNVCFLAYNLSCTLKLVSHLTKPMQWFRQSNILLMKQKFVVTNTIFQTKIPITRQLHYKHTFCQNAVSTKKLLYLIFSLKKSNILKCWSTEDQSCFFLSPLKLCISGVNKLLLYERYTQYNFDTAQENKS